MTAPASLRVPLAAYPGMNPFVMKWLAGDRAATQFLPRAAGDASGHERSPRSSAVAEALIESNRRWGLFVKPEVQRWAAGEGVTLVAGQQVGFAGGPLYTLAKIASLVKMKRDLASRGIPATVFFWLATEDHDFDEVAQLSVPLERHRAGALRDRQLDLLTIRAASFESRRAVGGIPIPEPLVAQLLAVCPTPRPAWLRPKITFGDSFAELIASIFGPEVVLVDSLLPALRRAGAPLFISIMERWDAIQAALANRSRQIAAAGFTPQVVPREGEAYSLFFELDDEDNRQLVDRPREFDDPERISTTALTRPLLQDFVLQPDVFIGGPAEVSYYAQIAPLHELLGVRMPRVALRGHALLMRERGLRFLERYRIAPEEIFTSADSLLAARETDGVAEVKRVAVEAKRELAARMEQIGEIALPAEHALARAVSRSVGHIEYHFQKLTERAIRGLARKDRERYAAAREVVATLYPDGTVQDRVVAWFPFWERYGQYLIDRLVEQIEPDTASLRIIPL